MDSYVKNFIEKNKQLIQYAKWDELFYEWCEHTEGLTAYEENEKYLILKQSLKTADLNVNWKLTDIAVTLYLLKLVKQIINYAPEEAFVHKSMLLRKASKLNLSPQEAENIVNYVKTTLNLRPTTRYNSKGYTWG